MEKNRDPRLVDFGKRVREARDAAELTQAAVTARLNAAGIKVPATAVAKIETGTRPTTVVELEALAAVLGVDPAQLLPSSSADIPYLEMSRLGEALDARAEFLEALARYRIRRAEVLDIDPAALTGRFAVGGDLSDVVEDPIDLVAAVVNGYYDEAGRPKVLGE